MVKKLNEPLQLSQNLFERIHFFHHLNGFDSLLLGCCSPSQNKCKRQNLTDRIHDCVYKLLLFKEGLTMILIDWQVFLLANKTN